MVLHNTMLRSLLNFVQSQGRRECIEEQSTQIKRLKWNEFWDDLEAITVALYLDLFTVAVT